MAGALVTMQSIKDELDKRVATIEAVLPSGTTKDAERHAKQAMLYFSRKPDLRKCSQQSLIQCVVDSAELGIPLNGRLGHAVAYGDSATFMPDWKGLVSVARRTGQIKDVVADVVCENDEFDCGREGNRSYVKHSPGLAGRGKTIGAYAVVTLPGDCPENPQWRYEYMTLEQLNAIRAKSRAKNNGPWVTDTDQMFCKTVIKRLLKSYCDDPTLCMALDADDAEYDDGEPVARPKKTQYVQALAHVPIEVEESPAEVIEHDDKPETPKGNPYAADFAKCKDHKEVVVMHGELMATPDGETDKALIEAAAKERKAQLK